MILPLLDHCRQKRAELQCHLDALRKGNLLMDRNDGRGRRVATSEYKEQVEDHIALLDKVIDHLVKTNA